MSAGREGVVSVSPSIKHREAWCSRSVISGWCKLCSGSAWSMESWGLVSGWVSGGHCHEPRGLARVIPVMRNWR